MRGASRGTRSFTGVTPLMVSKRIPITVLCPRCRASNSEGLNELLARTPLSIVCQSCRTAFPLSLPPGLPLRREAGTDSPTPPPMTVSTVLTSLASSSAACGNKGTANRTSVPRRGIRMPFWGLLGLVLGIVAASILTLLIASS